MKKSVIIVSCILLALVIVIGGVLGWRYYQDVTYIDINGTRYLRAETQLDMSDQQNPDLLSICQMNQLQRLDLRGTGISTDDYRMLRETLPECNILWDIPFQGSYYDENTSHLTVTELSKEDIETLTYFKNLREIDATDCTDYESIFIAKEQFPNCRISCQVTVCGQEYTESTVSITVANADTQELETALVWLPKLTEVHLTGALPEAQWIFHVMEQYPGVEFTWEYVLFDQTFDSAVTEIDLSNIPMDSTDTVEAALPYFPALSKVIMCNCGIPSEEMDALNQRHPDVRFVWNIWVDRCELRTDVTAFMPFKWGYTPEHPLPYNAYGELKYCTDMVCMDLGHMKLNDLSFLYYMPNLQYLMLADTIITDLTPIGTLKELVYLELFLTRTKDLSPLAGCTKLEDLNLSWTSAQNIEVLKDLPNLKNLWLLGNTYPYGALNELKEALPNLTMKTGKSGSSTGYGWRQLPNYYAQRDLLGMWYMSG